MKMFSDCSGECCVCSCGDFCLAGHGDDDYGPASKEQVIGRLNKGKYKGYEQMMKSYLRNKFNYDYDTNFQIGEWVYVDDWFYGRIMDIDGESVFVEFETDRGGGSLSFNLCELRHAPSPKKRRVK